MYTTSVYYLFVISYIIYEILCMKWIYNNNDCDELHDSVGGVDCGIDDATILLVLFTILLDTLEKVVLVGILVSPQFDFTHVLRFSCTCPSFFPF